MSLTSKTMRFSIGSIVVCVLALFSLSLQTSAQSNTKSRTTAPLADSSQATNENALPGNPASISVLFTSQEYAALRAARNYTGVVRPLEDFEDFEEEKELQLPPQEERFVTLGGIAYQSGKKWTIWLNGQRVTPEALPEEVLDLKVFKSYIEMRWYDQYTKRIMPIRLRANQRFHLDARIFLPG